jgi:hypothetical protein
LDALQHATLVALDALMTQTTPDTMARDASGLLLKRLINVARTKKCSMLVRLPVIQFAKRDAATTLTTATKAKRKGRVSGLERMPKSVVHGMTMKHSSDVQKPAIRNVNVWMTSATGTRTRKNMTVHAGLERIPESDVRKVTTQYSMHVQKPVILLVVHNLISSHCTLQKVHILERP